MIATLRTSPDIIAALPENRSQIGITTWFDTIVDSAIAATITIEVAAEKPPRKDRIASPSRPSIRGRVST